MENAGKFIGGILIGSAIGTAVGILVAPSSGRQTRKKLMKESKQMKKKADEMLADTIHSMRKEYNQKLDQFVSNGKNSIEQVKDKIRI